MGQTNNNNNSHTSNSSNNNNNKSSTARANQLTKLDADADNLRWEESAECKRRRWRKREGGVRRECKRCWLIKAKTAHKPSYKQVGMVIFTSKADLEIPYLIDNIIENLLWMFLSGNMQYKSGILWITMNTYILYIHIILLKKLGT